MKVEILVQKNHKFLWIDDYLWMWDTLPEKQVQYKISTQAFGDVLFAGYGLGIAQKYIEDNPNVNSLLTVEQSIDVIKANEKYDRIYGEYIIDDFYRISLDQKFDCIIGDIWEEVLPSGLENYKRFKEKALTMLKPDGKILAWGKDYFEYLIKKESK